MKSIYQVPLALEEEGLANEILTYFKLENNIPDLKNWQDIVNKIINPKKKTKIAIVGKYIQLHDAYLSVVESLKHAGAHLNTGIEIKWVDAENIKTLKDAKNELSDCKGVIVPGGFGNRGVDGKMLTIQYVREHNIPFLGICLGMQSAVMEFAKNVVGLEDVNSTEFNENAKNPVISIMDEQKEITQKGGTMRLGSYNCKIADNTKTKQLYKQDIISERHRHRYEVNNGYRDLLEQKGMTFAGLSPDGKLVEIIELKDKKFFIASQFHPELKSRPEKPHPLFVGLVEACI